MLKHHKASFILTLVLIALNALPIFATAGTPIPVTLDGIKMAESVHGTVLGTNTLYVPLRPVAEALGYTVMWQKESESVVVSGKGSNWEVEPSHADPDCWCTEPAMFVNGCTMVPASFCSQKLGLGVSLTKDAIELVSGKAHWVDTPDGKYSLILDVRNPDEFAAGHLERAVLIPVNELEKRMSEIEKYKSESILVYCKKGGRSSQAVEILRKAGFENLSNLKGGYDGYLEAHKK